MKVPFNLVAYNVPQIIGAPDQITKNLTSKNFPTSYDLRIPPNAVLANKEGSKSKIRPQEERDLSDALNNMNFGEDHSGKH